MLIIFDDVLRYYIYSPQEVYSATSYKRKAVGSSNPKKIFSVKKDFKDASISIDDSEIKNQMEKALARAKEDFL